MIDQAFNLMIYLKGKPMPYSLHHLKHSPFHILCRLPIERAPIHPAFDHLLFAFCVHLLFALRVHLLFALRVHSDGGVPGQNREAQKRDYSSTKGRSGLGQQSQRSGA